MSVGPCGLEVSEHFKLVRMHFYADTVTGYERNVAPVSGHDCRSAVHKISADKQIQMLVETTTGSTQRSWAEAIRSRAPRNIQL